MTLEDFFTLTEMKDGLTAPSRVEELVTVMKKEKESVVKNVSDVTRQWTAVASTIAATENKDCLDLFIQLDGLLFLDRWLKDAQEFGNDSSDSFVEESITGLLRALEKLHRNREASISSEIWTRVKNLLGHNSSRVQESARLLFDSWKQGRVTDHVDDSDGRKYEILDTATVTGENNGPQCSAKDGPVSRGSSHEENDGADAAKSENLPSSLDGVQPESAKDLPIETTKDELQPHINSDHSNMENRSPFLVASSFVSNPVQENSPKKEELPAKTVEETASHETCSLPDSKLENIEVPDAQKLNGLSSDEKLFDVTASNSSTVEHAGVGSALDVTKEPNSQNDSEASRSHVLESVNLADEKTHGSEPKKAVGDMEAMNHSSNSSQLFNIAGKDIESHLSMLRSSSEYKLMYKKPGNLETRFSRKSDVRIADEDKENCGFEDLRGGSRFTGSPVAMNTTTSDIELEYGIVDALEVARIVAQEVEREVVDDREPSSSSSENISEGGIRQPNALGSINGKQDLPSEALPKEVSAGPTQSAGAQTEGDGPINSDDADNEPKNELRDMESSQVTVAQDPEPNTEKSVCDFDLNQEVCSDDMERAATSITPVSVVSASRAAAVRGLPAAPLQFEGTLGWKGSAATSAFRPASPRRNSDGDKTLSLGGTSNSSKPRLDCLDFDLNVSEDVDEQGAELMSGKQVTASSGLHSAESSKANHRKSERLELDLNCISDDGDAPALDSRVEEQHFYDRNGHRSQSPVSSASPMQSSLRNFDLNDRPYSQNNALEQGPYPGRSSRNAIAHGGPKPNDPVISIMGTRVEVNRKDFVSQVVSFPNGKALEPATDGSTTRTASFMGLVPTALYSHSPAFSANGLPLAPKMSFSSAIYGPSGSIPYIVDSGAPVVPQLMGSTSAVPIAYSQAQFMMGMGNASAGLNGSVPSRPNIDLNFGLAIEGGNTESMGLRQPFMPAQGRSIEEHLRANTQASSSSGVAMKRKEPDGGWDPYTFNYRQQQFPWKQ
ncbi:hypothetical protein HRI_001917100 [Hibiscus trionum]|uniref:TFIIS N-terminal domain-containing protein n=1 Tax=Hibiscus trionum TaxID=183268 RepID=A0A9W7HTI4_HIBTR|nr:hypothetical protein HRI_001917100 [Hibiscus trionum]